MRRSFIVPLVALLALPAGTQAQQGPRPGQQVGQHRPWPRVSITPFMGFRVGFDREIEEIVVTDSEFETQAIVISESLVDEEGTTVPGLEVDFRVAGPISVVGSVVYDPGGTGILRVLTEEVSQILSVESPESLLGKVGVGIWLRESEPDLRLSRPNAQIFFGVAVREMDGLDTPGVDVADGLDESSTSWGANFGFKGETPIWRDRLVFQFGVEDYWTFWDDELAERHIESTRGEFGDFVRASVESTSSHLFLIRAGVSLQF